jgi:hypothetical protein
VAELVRPHQSPGWTEKLETGDRPPRQLPITFDPDAVRDRDDVVLAHLNHPLVAMSTRLLRAAVSNSEIRLNRVAAVVSDDPALEDVLVGAYSRFVLIGVDGVRLHEEVLHAAGWAPESGRFRRWENLSASGEVLSRALATGTPASAHVQARLAPRWPRIVDGLVNAIDWRSNIRQASLERALAERKREEQTVMPVLVPTGQVFSNALGIFATDDTAMLALLSSAPHYWWAVSRASTMKTDLRYTPSDVFEKFPLPALSSELRELGDAPDTFRRDVMLARNSGLTKTYNLVFDPTVSDADIVELRRIHREIDIAAIKAYGWDDLLDQLDHGFHPAGRDLRYTIGPAAQREILDRLLELNHARYAEEVAAGLHDKKKGRKAAARPEPGGLF